MYEASTLSQPQLAFKRLQIQQPQENVLTLIEIYFFGSSLTLTGSSSVLELLETIGNSAYRVLPSL